jgi:hypothetical protein
MTEYTTISSLALNIFMYSHYREKSIALIKSIKIFNDIKSAYYGGTSEVY